MIGRKEDLLVEGYEIGDVSFVAGHAPEALDVVVKLRYRRRPVGARLVKSGLGNGAGGFWRIMFDRPQSGVARGQVAVVYRDDEVLGGGTIEAHIRIGGSARP